MRPDIWIDGEHDTVFVGEAPENCIRVFEDIDFKGRFIDFCIEDPTE